MKTESLGMPYEMMDNFSICGLQQAKKSSYLAGYFGESSLLDTNVRVDMEDHVTMVNKRGGWCEISCTSMMWN